MRQRFPTGRGTRFRIGCGIALFAAMGRERQLARSWSSAASARLNCSPRHPKVSGWVVRRTCLVSKRTRDRQPRAQCISFLRGGAIRSGSCHHRFVKGEAPMESIDLFFRFPEVVKIAEHAVAARQHVQSVTQYYNDEPAEAALMWVKDDGTYLMSGWESTPARRSRRTRRPITGRLRDRLGPTDRPRDRTHSGRRRRFLRAHRAGQAGIRQRHPARSDPPPRRAWRPADHHRQSANVRNSLRACRLPVTPRPSFDRMDLHRHERPRPTPAWLVAVRAIVSVPAVLAPARRAQPWRRRLSFLDTVDIGGTCHEFLDLTLDPA